LIKGFKRGIGKSLAIALVEAELILFEYQQVWNEVAALLEMQFSTWEEIFRFNKVNLEIKTNLRVDYRGKNNQD